MNDRNAGPLHDGGPVVVVGLGYGDEGKGAAVDHLAATRGDTVAVVRFSGGAQAAHNVRHGPRHHTFHQFGSATLLDVGTILRAPTIVDPLLLAVEADDLAGIGVRDPLALVSADARCLVSTPIHAALNRAREILRGDARHGSTGLGIGETVAFDLAVRSRARRGDVIGNFVSPSDAPRLPALTVGDLRDEARTRRALDALAGYAEPLLARAGHADAAHAPVEAIAKVLVGVGRELTVLDSADAALSSMLADGTVIFEGSQGILLDEWHGFHPHTTWASITPRALVAELEALGHRPYVLGLTRCYATRHGAGPMPTQDDLLVLDEPDNREGRYQGAWRTGHLDLPALRYAAAVAGRIDGVAVSHLDQLEGSGLKVADSWDGEQRPIWPGFGKDIASMEARTARALAARPDYQALGSDPLAVTEMIGRAVGAPVVITAHGPARTDRRYA